MHEVQSAEDGSCRNMKASPGRSNSDDVQDDKPTSSVNVETKDLRNDLGPYGDDDSSSDDNSSSSSSSSPDKSADAGSSSDSDSDNLASGTESDDDQIDLELLHGLEEIHITVQRRSGDASVNSELLVPKGPQKAHKIRKQGKTASVPYQQQGASGSRNVGAGYPQGTPGGGAGAPYPADDRVDMVLSESLNDPGFRNNLMYTLEAEVEQSYPKLITPPLSSSDCSYPPGYSSCRTGSNQNHASYYQQYTPESLHTASPQGSDVSLEDETYTASQESGYQTSGDVYLPPSHQNQNKATQPPLLSPPTSNPSPHYIFPNNLYHNADDPHLNHGSRRESNQLPSDGNDLNASDKPLSNAEKFIDNMCSGVKYFLASAKRHPGEVIEPYLLSEDRTHSLLALARVIGSKLESLKETEKRLALAASGESHRVYEYL